MNAFNWASMNGTDVQNQRAFYNAYRRTEILYRHVSALAWNWHCQCAPCIQIPLYHAWLRRALIRLPARNNLKNTRRRRRLADDIAQEASRYEQPHRPEDYLKDGEKSRCGAVSARKDASWPGELHAAIRRATRPVSAPPHAGVFATSESKWAWSSTGVFTSTTLDEADSGEDPEAAAASLMHTQHLADDEDDQSLADVADWCRKAKKLRSRMNPSIQRRKESASKTNSRAQARSKKKEKDSRLRVPAVCVWLMRPVTEYKPKPDQWNVLSLSRVSVYESKNVYSLYESWTKVFFGYLCTGTKGTPFSWKNTQKFFTPFARE